MPTLPQIVKLNRDGWVLYHRPSCPYCVEVKKRVGIIKWAAMNKINIEHQRMPAAIAGRGVPTWYNAKTKKIWDGGGVFR